MKRKFQIIAFDPKTKQATVTSTFTTKDNIDDKALKILIKAEMDKTFYKNAIWSILR